RTPELQSAEIYSPASKSFTSIGPMTAARQQHTATLLADHRVFIAGGFGTGFGSAELFDPATSTFTAIAQPMPLRAEHTATLLSDGRVLLAGGAEQNGNTVKSADLFNPLTMTFSPAGSMRAYRSQHTATLMPDGSVLFAGGLTSSACCDLQPPHAPLERLVPGTGFGGGGSMSAARRGRPATRLPDGS